jgi:hypothetical protein
MAPRRHPRLCRRPIPRLRKHWALIALLAAATLAAGWSAVRQGSFDRSPIGLFTSLPILWSEGSDLAAEISGAAPPHWAKPALAARGPIQPLDMLSGPPGHAPLDKLKRLVMAQPRALSPQENVALDNWVRAGGHLLLLADPALTEDSAFAIGDPRRPQTVVLLSPILDRWGLELRFDDAQAFGETEREVMDRTIPVNLPGQFATQGQANCRLWGGGLAVTCAIGKGRMVALADAAVLEREDPDGTRADAFGWLLDAAFAAR